MAITPRQLDIKGAYIQDAYKVAFFVTPISYCLGEGRRCRNYTAKLKGVRA